MPAINAATGPMLRCKFILVPPGSACGAPLAPRLPNRILRLSLRWETAPGGERCDQRRTCDMSLITPDGPLFHLMAAAIANFTAVEVGSVHALRRVEFLATRRHRAMVSVGGMEVVIDVATEAARTVKPRAGADEDIAA